MGQGRWQPVTVSDVTPCHAMPHHPWGRTCHTPRWALLRRLQSTGLGWVMQILSHCAFPCYSCCDVDMLPAVGCVASRIHHARTLPAPSGFDRSGRRYSLLEYALRETEQLHGKLRRYTSPGEHAFYPGAVRCGKGKGGGGKGHRACCPLATARTRVGAGRATGPLPAWLGPDLPLPLPGPTLPCPHLQTPCRP